MKQHGSQWCPTHLHQTKIWPIVPDFLQAAVHKAKLKVILDKLGIKQKSGKERVNLTRVPIHQKSAVLLT